MIPFSRAGWQRGNSHPPGPIRCLARWNSEIAGVFALAAPSTKATTEAKDGADRNLSHQRPLVADVTAPLERSESRHPDLPASHSMDWAQRLPEPGTNG